MTIIGRTTKDAVVNTVKDNRKVVNFSIAINDTYKPRGGERVQATTYCNCSYWVSDSVAEHLKKGALLEVVGRIFLSTFTTSDGTVKASLNCHVNSIKIHAWPKDAKQITEVPSGNSTDGKDDLPF